MYYILETNNSDLIYPAVEIALLEVTTSYLRFLSDKMFTFSKLREIDPEIEQARYFDRAPLFLTEEGQDKVRTLITAPDQELISIPIQLEAEDLFDVDPLFAHFDAGSVRWFGYIDQTNMQVEAGPIYRMDIERLLKNLAAPLPVTL